MCTDKLNSLSVQCKFGDAATLELSTHLWNRLLVGFHPGQLSIVLRAASDTLPTPMNLQRWKIQTGSACSLCNCLRPTSAHILNGCPTALQQGRYTYHYDQVLLSLLLHIQKCCSDYSVFAELIITELVTLF